MTKFEGLFLKIDVVYCSKYGRVAELVDALDSKSCSRKGVRVQVPLRPPLLTFPISSNPSNSGLQR